MFSSFKVDFWILLGLSAQGLFFLRFIFQWYYLEKQKKKIVPKIFWYISLLGAFTILAYALARKDIVFLVTGILQVILYVSSIMLCKNEC